MDANANRIIVLAANSSWALTNYRLRLLKELQRAGFGLVALVPVDAGISKLLREGIEVRPVPISAHGTSLVAEARLLASYVSQLRALQPCALLGFTIKPNIYGAIAGRITGVPVINNVTGLGLGFTSGRPLRFVVGLLYRIAFRSSRQVFFQNHESRELFLSTGLVRQGQAALLPGSGIDLDQFKPTTETQTEPRPFTFLLPSRLMWQKGIGEYCAAARQLRRMDRDIRFQILGAVEPAWNKDAIDRNQIREWQREGVEYLGAVEDVRPNMAAADCVVLPSYYPEGVPRSLIEAAAMGKPVITADMPGCRDVVVPDETGFLCVARSIDSLASTMTRMLGLSNEQRSAMGRRARQKAEREFDERFVIDAYLAAIDTIVSKEGEIGRSSADLRG